MGDMALGSKWKVALAKRRFVHLVWTTAVAAALALALNGFARADEVCALQAPCPSQLPAPGYRVELSEEINQSGGELVDERSRVTIAVPSGAVSRSVTLTYETAVAMTSPLVDDNLALNSFRLAATDKDGSALTEFDKDWALTFAYSDCDAPGPCIAVPLDEASLHCSRYDAPTGVWVDLSSRPNPFNKSLECESDQLGTFVIAARPVGLDGNRIRSITFLPAILR